MVIHDALVVLLQQWTCLLPGVSYNTFQSGGNSVSGFELGEYFKCLTNLSIIPTIFPLVQQENGFCCN